MLKILFIIWCIAQTGRCEENTQYILHLYTRPEIKITRIKLNKNNICNTKKKKYTSETIIKTAMNLHIYWVNTPLYAVRETLQLNDYYNFYFLLSRRPSVIDKLNWPVVVDWLFSEVTTINFISYTLFIPSVCAPMKA